MRILETNIYLPEYSTVAVVYVLTAGGLGNDLAVYSKAVSRSAVFAFPEEVAEEVAAGGDKLTEKMAREVMPTLNQHIDSGDFYYRA